MMVYPYLNPFYDAVLRYLLGTDNPVSPAGLAKPTQRLITTTERYPIAGQLLVAFGPEETRDYIAFRGVLSINSSPFREMTTHFGTYSSLLHP